MKYEKPNLELVFAEDIVVTSYLYDEGVGSGIGENEKIIF